MKNGKPIHVTYDPKNGTENEFLCETLRKAYLWYVEGIHV
jgi:hypothetical protein